MQPYPNSPGTSTISTDRPATGGPAGAGLRSAAGPLGTSANLRNPPPSTARDRRLERFALQSVSRSLLPKERVKHCLRTPQREKYTVDVFRSLKHDAFHYKGLQTCGSVWHCPLCAGKISERRRVELVSAVQSWRDQGGGVQLLTLTVPHYSHDSLAKVLEGISDARRRLLNRKPWKRLALRIGLVGQIRALEVTYGVNGWHVHFHVLCFLEKPLHHLDGFHAGVEVLDQWQSACLAAGLPEPNYHGVKFEDGDQAAQYVGKWGIEHEMTKAHVKKSREGYTPFDLLRVSLGTYDGNCSLNLDETRAGKVFQEYAILFKGKTQLKWSRGLRDRLGLDHDLTDEELAAQVEDDAFLFASIPLEVWRLVVRFNLRGQVLEIARKGENAFYQFLLAICMEDKEFSLRRGLHGSGVDT